MAHTKNIAQEEPYCWMVFTKMDLRIVVGSPFIPMNKFKKSPVINKIRFTENIPPIMKPGKSKFMVFLKMERKQANGSGMVKMVN